jgi:hypothetical protein
MSPLVLPKKKGKVRASGDSPLVLSGGKAMTTPWPFFKERGRRGGAVITTWSFLKGRGKGRTCSDDPFALPKGKSKSKSKGQTEDERC